MFRTVEVSRKFQVQTYNLVIDTFVNCLHERREQYSSINSKFGFLDDLVFISVQQLRKDAFTLQQAYQYDLENILTDEVVALQSLLQCCLPSVRSSKEDKDYPNNAYCTKLL